MMEYLSNTFDTYDRIRKSELHIDFRTQCFIMTLAGGGRVIANDVFKMRKVIEFQSLSCYSLSVQVKYQS